MKKCDKIVGMNSIINKGERLFKIVVILMLLGIGVLVINHSHDPQLVNEVQKAETLLEKELEEAI